MFLAVRILVWPVGIIGIFMSELHLGALFLYGHSLQTSELSMKANDFIKKFSILESEIETLLGVPRGSNSFVENLRRAAPKVWVVKKNLAFLKEVASYRNTLAHSQLDQVLVQPTGYTLKKLDEITTALSDKKSLSDFIKKLTVFKGDEPFSEALQLMKENDFSQIVVSSDGQHGILSSDGVSNWLTQSISDDLISLTETRVGDVLGYEPKGSFGLIRRASTFFDACSMMNKLKQNQIQRVHAILITQNGKRSDTPIGIITPWDLILD